MSDTEKQNVNTQPPYGHIVHAEYGESYDDDGCVEYETFHRATLVEAEALARELEKEKRVTRLMLDGGPFINTSSPDGLYMHQSRGPCPLCKEYLGCARCDNTEGAYYSVKPTHYHSREVEAYKGHEGIHDLLCYKCHREDRLAVYGPTYGEQAA